MTDSDEFVQGYVRGYRSGKRTRLLMAQRIRELEAEQSRLIKDKADLFRQVLKLEKAMRIGALLEAAGALEKEHANDPCSGRF